MISFLNPQAQSFLAGVNQIQEQLDEAQTELTTGLKINNVSDAPGEIADLWQTRSEVDQVDQVTSNLNSVTTEVNTAESVLQNATTLVDNAETIGAQGVSGTATADTRQSLADQLGTILQELVSAANTQVGGRYIFSGDDDQQPAYSIDLTQSDPISAYQGTASTREIQGADGSQFSIALTAQQIFDSSDAQQNVFQSINNLREALLNNDDTGINAAIGDVQSAGTFLNQQLAFYGEVQDQVTSATNFAQNDQTQLETQLSGIQDADETQAITQLTQSQTELQAALESEAKLPQTTLFDFLA